jgi:hypothetical protein
VETTPQVRESRDLQTARNGTRRNLARERRDGGVGSMEGAVGVVSSLQVRLMKGARKLWGFIQADLRIWAEFQETDRDGVIGRVRILGGPMFLGFYERFQRRTHYTEGWNAVLPQAVQLELRQA